MRSALIAAIVASVVSVAAATAAAPWITGKDVKDETLTYRDIKRSSITVDRLASSVRYLLKPRPDPAPASTAPAPTIAAAEPLRTVIMGNTAALPPDGARTVVGVACPRGMVTLGGGAQVGEGSATFNMTATPETGGGAVTARSEVDYSSPTLDGRGWTSAAHADGPGQVLAVAVICTLGRIAGT